MLTKPSPIGRPTVWQLTCYLETLQTFKTFTVDETALPVHAGQAGSQ